MRKNGNQKNQDWSKGRYMELVWEKNSYQGSPKKRSGHPVREKKIKNLRAWVTIFSKRQGTFASGMTKGEGEKRKVTSRSP